VSIVTDLAISGLVAQFGRGVTGDVSARLLEQFVRNLETGVLGAGA
jgi:carbon monoxide dehydrogenase subunit G